MGAKPTFSDVLDAADELDVESQEELIAVLRRRLAERGRARILRAAEEAEQEFEVGKCLPTTGADLIRKALS